MGRRNKCTLEGPIWPQLHKAARFSVNVCALHELGGITNMDWTMPIGGGAHCHPAGDLGDRPVICIRSEDMTERYCECGVGSLLYHEVAHALAGRNHHNQTWRMIRRLLGHGASIDIAHNLDHWERVEGESLFETMERIDDEDEAA